MLIELNGISKVYVRGTEEVHALRSVDLAIDDNEYVALMGPSGSGKSTLMNILGCLDSPTDGTYRLAGTDVSGMNANELAEVRNSRVGFIFQTFNLLPRASALQNVELPLIYNGQRRKVRRERAIQALERVGLADRMTPPPNRAVWRPMSAGGHCPAPWPTGLHCCWPTSRPAISTLAPARRSCCSSTPLHEEGNTVLLVTHDPVIALQAERLIRIHDGRIASDEQLA